jgi:NTE family protein
VAWRGLLALMAGTLSACAHYTRNLPLPPSGGGAGYTLAAVRGPLGSGAGGTPATRDSLLLLMSASGGGTRAAALTHGVLAELADTPLPGGGFAADELDVLSAVSGGSFAATHFALHGAAGLPAFRRHFLDWNAQRSLLLSVLVPGPLVLPSPTYSRIDLAERLWRRRLFGEATFGDLLARTDSARAGGVSRPPMLIINGTDFSTGGQFSFTSEHFRTICTDLLRVPLARAVATSSAFPGLLNPTSFRNYAGGCRDSLPAWASEFFAAESLPEGAELRTTPEGREKARAAAQLASLQRGALRTHIHVLDGGVSDNLGLRPLVRAVTQGDHDESLLPELNAGHVRKILWIVVNARTARPAPSDRKANPPGWKEVLDASASRPMNRLTDETLEALGDRIGSRRRAVAAACARSGPDALPATLRVQEYVLYVAFDQLQDARERAYFLGLPTTFALPREAVDALVAFGRRAVRSSGDFRAFLTDRADGEGVCGWARREWQPGWRGGDWVP